MNLPFFIARRYLLAKKSHNAINIISMISVCSVAVATVALVCVLSVFNGFHDLSASMFGNFDPELKITAVEGKVFDPTTEPMRRVRAMPEVALSTEVLQDNVLVRYGGRQQIAVAKGVDSTFQRAVPIDTVLIDGRFVLREGETAYGVPGIGLASVLGINASFTEPMEIYAPKRDVRVNTANPATSFQIDYAFIGGVFCINQAEYDEQFLILPIDLVRDMLRYDNGEVSALELKLAPGANLRQVKRDIARTLGKGFRVQDRFEQQEASFRMMQIEKWMTFLILAFILTIALFNVVSSLSMLIIEKEDDVHMLRSMGADDGLIRRIFLFEGCMIPLVGATVGIVLGVVICLVQQHFGLIRLGEVGAFISDKYPVRVSPTDLLTIFITVFAIGALTSWYPVRTLRSGRWPNDVSKAAAGALLVLGLSTTTGCAGGGSQVGNDASVVTVTMEAQRYFAERIGGGHFTIHTIVPPGQSPETFDPTPQEMMAVARSRAYLRIGRIGFEQVWMPTIMEQNPHLHVFDLSEGVRWIDGDRHAHDGHNHGAGDPHIWNAPATARIIADNTLRAFCLLDSAHTADYRSAHAALLAEIDSTDAALHAMLDTLTRRTFIIYHPALTYFADAYGLRQLSIETDGKEPSASSMKALIDAARAEGVRVVFVQREFDRKHAESVAAEIGARVVVIDPLSAAWKDEMLRIGCALVEP